MNHRTPLKIGETIEISTYARLAKNRDRRGHETSKYVPPVVKDAIKAIPNKHKRARIRKASRYIMANLREADTYTTVSDLLDEVVEETGIARSLVRQALSMLMCIRLVSLSQNGIVVLARED